MRLTTFAVRYIQNVCARVILELRSSELTWEMRVQANEASGHLITILIPQRNKKAKDQHGLAIFSKNERATSVY